MVSFVARLSAVVLVCGGGLVACAAQTDEADEFASTSSEEGEEVMSDEGLGASADALIGGRIAPGTVVTTTARVNFRAGPSTSKTVLRVIPRGDPVIMVDGTPAGNGFYKVKEGSDVGYMHGAYLVPAEIADDQANDAPAGSNVSQTGRRVSATALYLGSCEFLGTCASAASQRAWSENRTILFGCDGRQTCDDSEPYLSVPRNGPRCGYSVKICRVTDRNNCVYAKVRERSDSNQRYELSPAAALAIDLDPHDRYFNDNGNGRCSGTMGGDARVTITY